MKISPNKLKPILLGVLLTTLIIGCEKGEDGEPGKNGSANIASNTYVVSSWAYSSPYYYADLYVPELTAENINSAGVMVYFSNVDGNWKAIPFTQYETPDNYFMNFITSIGNIRVTWAYDNALSPGSNPSTYYGTAVKYKVVVIPPAAKMLAPNVNLKNYNEVKEAFHLKD